MHRTWWLVVAPERASTCAPWTPAMRWTFIESDLKTMTAIWMGLETVREALRDRHLKLVGDKTLASTIQTWLGLSPFARVSKLAA